MQNLIAWITVATLSLLGGASVVSDVHAQIGSGKKYDLDAGPCAAKGYPMTIQYGVFSTGPKGTIVVPWGHHLNGAWGLSSRSWVGGSSMHPVPDRLKLLYFSFLEDKFYEGDFVVPTARIRELLEEGFWDSEKRRRQTYTKLTVCVLPKGMVVLWMSGIGRQVQLSRFQAQISKANFKEYFPASERAEMFKETLAEVPEAVRAEVKSSQLSADRWDRLLEKYRWDLQASEALAMNDYNMTLSNGEVMAEPLTNDRKSFIEFLTTPMLKAPPQRMSLYMTTAAGRRFDIKVDSFDEVQTQTAFQTLTREAPNSAITLWLQIDPGLTQATFTLQNATQKIVLNKSPVRITRY